jgi:hypothetical protein
MFRNTGDIDSFACLKFFWCCTWKSIYSLISAFNTMRITMLAFGNKWLLNIYFHSPFCKFGKNHYHPSKDNHHMRYYVWIGSCTDHAFLVTIFIFLLGLKCVSLATILPHECPYELWLPESTGPLWRQSCMHIWNRIYITSWLNPDICKGLLIWTIPKQ